MCRSEDGWKRAAMDCDVCQAGHKTQQVAIWLMSQGQKKSKSLEVQLGGRALCLSGLGCGRPACSAQPAMQTRRAGYCVRQSQAKPTTVRLGPSRAIRRAGSSSSPSWHLQKICRAVARTATLLRRCSGKLEKATIHSSECQHQASTKESSGQRFVPG